MFSKDVFCASHLPDMKPITNKIAYTYGEKGPSIYKFLRARLISQGSSYKMNFRNLLITNLTEDEMGSPFKAISDERRRTILKILGRNDASAGEIASKFNVSQPTVSNHLKILKEAGLIKEKKVKQNRIYSLNRAELRKVIEVIEELMKG